MWIEELAEFKTEDEVTTITNSMLRGELDDGLFYKFSLVTTHLRENNRGLTKIRNLIPT